MMRDSFRLVVLVAVLGLFQMLIVAQDAAPVVAQQEPAKSPTLRNDDVASLKNQVYSDRPIWASEPTQIKVYPHLPPWKIYASKPADNTSIYFAAPNPVLAYYPDSPTFDPQTNTLRLQIKFPSIPTDLLDKARNEIRDRLGKETGTHIVINEMIPLGYSVSVQLNQGEEKQELVFAPISTIQRIEIVSISKPISNRAICQALVESPSDVSIVYEAQFMFREISVTQAEITRIAYLRRNLDEQLGGTVQGADRIFITRRALSAASQRSSDVIRFVNRGVEAKTLDQMYTEFEKYYGNIQAINHSELMDGVIYYDAMPKGEIVPFVVTRNKDGKVTRKRWDTSNSTNNLEHKTEDNKTGESVSERNSSQYVDDDSEQTGRVSDTTGREQNQGTVTSSGTTQESGDENIQENGNTVAEQGVVIPPSLDIVQVKFSEISQGSGVDFWNEFELEPIIRAVRYRLPIEGQSKKTRTIEDFAPVGAIVAYYGTVAPNGWLLCDGNPIPTNDTQYDELRKHLKKMQLPDNVTPNMQGMFLRGIASGRALGTRQEDAVRHWSKITYPIFRLYSV